MHRISWGAALLAVVVLAEGAAADCPQCEKQTGYGAAPCAAGVNIQGGCCDCTPTPCDNAWAGYCQEKARRQAFWAGVGTGSGGAAMGGFPGIGRIGWRTPQFTRASQCTTCVTTTKAGGGGLPKPAAAAPATPLEPLPDGLIEPAPLPPTPKLQRPESTWRLPRLR